MKILLVNRGDLKKLASEFNVTTRTVYNALQYKVGGGRAEEIRDAALKMGGIKIL